MLSLLIGGVTLPLTHPDLARASSRTGRRIILVELSGANDGLNTVVPFADDRYTELRPTIALKRDHVFQIAPDAALHLALQPLDIAWSSGDLAVVQGLGNDGQTRSHFQAIDQWNTGGLGDDGWLTRDFERLPNAAVHDALGISLDGALGPLQSTGGGWISLTSWTQTKHAGSRAAPDNIALPSQNPAMALLQSRTHTLDIALRRVAEKIDRDRALQTSPIEAGEVGRQATMAARLIAAGVDAPVLKIKIDGFDTHENQLWRHADRLDMLGTALAGLRQHLIRSGHWDTTLIMTYSEFGRRAAENGSGGTDHGAAAPHFLMGGGVRGGLWGQPPDLGALIDGDVGYTLDYRALYDRVLTDWFGMPGNRFRAHRTGVLDGLFRT